MEYSKISRIIKTTRGKNKKKKMRCYYMALLASLFGWCHYRIHLPTSSPYIWTFRNLKSTDLGKMVQESSGCDTIKWGIHFHKKEFLRLTLLPYFRKFTYNKNTSDILTFTSLPAIQSRGGWRKTGKYRLSVNI